MNAPTTSRNQNNWRWHYEHPKHTAREDLRASRLCRQAVEIDEGKADRGGATDRNAWERRKAANGARDKAALMVLASEYAALGCPNTAQQVMAEAMGI